MVANTAGGSQETGWILVRLVWRLLLVAWPSTTDPRLKVSVVVFETVLLYRVCPALVNQGAASARFLDARRALRQTSHRDHHAAARTLESRTQAAYRKLPIQSSWVNHTKANLFLLVLETLLVSDQEMQLFEDQGMDMESARHCSVLTVEFADDRRDMEETVLDNDRIQKSQQCG